MTSLMPPGRRIAHRLAAAAVLALAVGVAVATAASRPLPAGIDPAMQAGGRSSSTTSTTATSSSSSSAASPPTPMATDPAIGIGVERDGPYHSVDQQLPQQPPPPPPSAPAVGKDGSLQLVDLMLDACFAPTGELADYNE